MIFSVVIPCYRRPELVINAVSSVLRQDFDPDEYELVIVDSSPDDSVVQALDALRAGKNRQFSIHRKNPEGPGPSRNLGVARSTGKFIAFLDSDCQASEGWLSALHAGFREGIGIVQGRTLPIAGKHQGIFDHTIRVEREGVLYETANIAYRREAFGQAGGFKSDQNPLAETPLGGEDTDLAWKVRRRGWVTHFAQDALVFHEIMPMRKVDWFWISRLQVFPWLVSQYPELRDSFFLRYFYDQPQAWLTLGLLGALISVWLPILGAMLFFPYIYFRAAEPTRSLRGPLRLARPVFYLLRDFSSFCILAWASVRFRTLLL